MIEQACENTWLYGVSDLPSFRLRRPCVLFLRYQKLWKSYVKLRHLLANSPKVKFYTKLLGLSKIFMGVTENKLCPHSVQEKPLSNHLRQ